VDGEQSRAVITIRQQVIGVEGKILGAVEGLTCPYCSDVYTELRVEPVNVSRSGAPAPFVAPTWGEAGRRAEVAAEISGLIAEREEKGIPEAFGAPRCPSCGRGVRSGPDPTYFSVMIGAGGWLLVGGIIGAAAALITFNLTVGASTGTHADAVGAAIPAALIAFLASAVLVTALALIRRRAAIRAMAQLRPERAVDSIAAGDWGSLKLAAQMEKVAPAALLYTLSHTLGGKQRTIGFEAKHWLTIGFERDLREDVERSLTADKIHWILPTASAGTQPKAPSSADRPRQ
jgi:hypothetical protein